MSCDTAPFDTVLGMYNGPDKNICVDNRLKLTLGNKYELELCFCEGNNYAYINDDNGEGGHVPLDCFRIENNGNARMKKGGK